MSKRLQDNDEDMREAKSAPGVRDLAAVDNEDMGEFEDPWEDEVESDEEVIIANDDDDEEEGKPQSFASALILCHEQ